MTTTATIAYATAAIIAYAIAITLVFAIATGSTFYSTPAATITIATVTHDETH